MYHLTGCAILLPESLPNINYLLSLHPLCMSNLVPSATLFPPPCGWTHFNEPRWTKEPGPFRLVVPEDKRMYFVTTYCALLYIKVSYMNGNISCSKCSSPRLHWPAKYCNRTKPIRRVAIKRKKRPNFRLSLPWNSTEKFAAWRQEFCKKKLTFQIKKRQNKIRDDNWWIMYPFESLCVHLLANNLHLAVGVLSKPVLCTSWVAHWLTMRMQAEATCVESRI